MYTQLSGSFFFSFFFFAVNLSTRLSPTLAYTHIIRYNHNIKLGVYIFTSQYYFGVPALSFSLSLSHFFDRLISGIRETPRSEIAFIVVLDQDSPVPLSYPFILQSLSLQLLILPLLFFFHFEA